MTHSKRTGFLNSNWHGGSAELVCIKCGKLFAVIPSRKNKARCCSLSCWNSYQKEHPASPPNKGVKRKTSCNLAFLICRQCGAIFEVPYSRRTLHSFCTFKCRSEWKRTHYSGSNNPAWLGGKSKEPYPYNWNEISDGIMRRDSYHCMNPRCFNKSTRLDVHHIDYGKANCAPANLITLCDNCHSQAHHDRVRCMNIMHVSNATEAIQ